MALVRLFKKGGSGGGGGSNSIINLNDGILVTGNIDVTKTLSVLIPANTFAVGDAFRFVVRMIKISGSGISVMRAALNTTDDILGSTVISQSTMVSADRFAQHERTVFIKSSTVTQTIGTTSSLYTDNTAVSVLGTSNINWTVDQWLILTLQNTVLGEQTRGVGIVIEKYL
jgi:hypothetical protein